MTTKCNTLNYHDLPQYGFGDWIKRNAGTIGNVAGLAASFIPGVGPLAGTAIKKGMGAIGQGVQSNYENEQSLEANNKMAEEQAAVLEKQKQAAEYQADLAKKTANLNSFQNNITNGSNPTASFAMGGDFNQTSTREAQVPSELTRYEGQTHSGPNGGIPVDNNANPSVSTGAQPIARVEDGEVAWKDPNSGETYVFSNRINS